MEQKDLLCDIGHWRIPKENSKKHLECCLWILNDQKSRRKKFHYTTSRFLQLAEAEMSSSDESWMWINEYENRDAYDKMMKAMEEDDELVRLRNQWHGKWEPMMVPGSLKRQLWTERFRVD